MSEKWHKFLKGMGLGEWYEECSLDNCKLLPPAVVKKGREWVEDRYKNSLYINGCAGSGKTWFSMALCRALCEQGCPWMIFKDSYELDNELLESMEMNQEKSVLRKYQEVPVLFLDDLGVERSTERSLRQYYAIINSRIQSRRLTVVSSNLDRQALSQSIGDRIVSRMELFFEMRFPQKDLRRLVEPIKTAI